MLAEYTTKGPLIWKPIIQTNKVEKSFIEKAHKHVISGMKIAYLISVLPMTDDPNMKIENTGIVKKCMGLSCRKRKKILCFPINVIPFF